jgi:hypothetical protein
VQIVLHDGPGFAEAFVGTITHQAVPLPVNPMLPSHDIMETAARHISDHCWLGQDRSKR